MRQHGILVCFRNSFTYNARCLPHPPAHVKAYPLPTSFKHPDVVDFPGALAAWWRRLLLAAAFLTCLPLARRTPRTTAGAISPASREPSELNRATGLFPLVGALIGLVAGLALLGAFQLGLHPLACAFIALATSIALSGALHEDGLGDFADGLGGATRQDRLAIMRDNRIGTFGTLALLFGVGIRAAILGGLTSPEAAAGSHHRGGDLAGDAAWVMRWQRPARADGLAAGVGAPANADVATAAARRC